MSAAEIPAVSHSLAVLEGWILADDADSMREFDVYREGSGERPWKVQLTSELSQAIAAGHSMADALRLAAEFVQRDPTLQALHA